MLVSLALPGALAAQDKKAVDVLATARALASTEFAGWTYGSDAKTKTVDCVGFVHEVAKQAAKQCGKEIDAATKKALVIDLDKADHAKLQELVKASDPKIQGVARALVEAGLGTRVEPKDARPGDLVQYWYAVTTKEKDASGKEVAKTTWAGHSGIVESVDPKTGEATIFGSHKTTLKKRADGQAIELGKGGIGSGPVFDLANAKRKVFVVRWSTPSTKTQAK